MSLTTKYFYGIYLELDNAAVNGCFISLHSISCLSLAIGRQFVGPIILGLMLQLTPDPIPISITRPLHACTWHDGSERVLMAHQYRYSSLMSSHTGTNS